MPDKQDEKVEAVFNLDALIQASAEEDTELVGTNALESEQFSPQISHPVAIIIAWLLCLSVGMIFWLDPLPQQRDLGVRSIETRLSVAMYHVAHRVETYRRFTGSLPDYLDPDWSESQRVEYVRHDDGYQLVGKEGEYTLEYRQGDDPEALIHHGILRLGERAR